MKTPADMLIQMDVTVTVIVLDETGVIAKYKDDRMCWNYENHAY